MRQGFSLVEVLVAGAVLGLVLTFTLGPLMTSDRASRQVLIRQEKVVLANQLLARVAVEPSLEELVTEGTEVLKQDSAHGQETVALSWTIALESLTPHATKVIVQVSGPGQPKIITLESRHFEVVAK